MKKIEITILPWEKLDLPSYHGIVRGCRSESQSKAHRFISLP